MSEHESKLMHGTYIQFGCGTCAPPGWRNFDAGPAFWLQKRIPFSKPALLRKGYPDYPTRDIEYGDVIKGLPVQPNSAAGVYCSHILEHLALSEFRRALRNVITYLMPGGRFRLVVPDLEFLIHQYSGNASPDAAMAFMQNAVLGEHSASRGIGSLPQRLFGRSKHLWMWDYKAMSVELAEASFEAIRRASYNDSQDARFKEVENPGRWQNCLGVECIRPHHATGGLQS